VTKTGQFVCRNSCRKVVQTVSPVNTKPEEWVVIAACNLKNYNNMTAQEGETLIYKGKKTTMATEPLEQYLLTRPDIKFLSPSTACWRGYYGKWEIQDNKLYLTGLKAYIEGYREVNLDYLFPGQKRVFASWFNGEIRIPMGEMLQYVHMGYCSVFEKDIILTFIDGILTGEMVIDNRKKFKNNQNIDSSTGSNFSDGDKN